MTVDREQTRRDAELTLNVSGEGEWLPYEETWRSLAVGCLALLAELEQAERDRDEKEALAANYRGMWAGQRNRANAAEARLALADTLAEAGEEMCHPLEAFLETSDAGMHETRTILGLIDRWRAALAAYEQGQKPWDEQFEHDYRMGTTPDD